MRWKHLISNLPRRPENDGGGGNNGDDSGDDTGGGAGAGSSDNTGGDGGPPPSLRPEFIPEKFWKDETYLEGEGEERAVNWQKLAEDMANHHRAAENKIFTRKDDLVKEVREELEAEYAKPPAGVPESPDKYEFKADKDLLPEGVELSETENDPHMQWFKQTAHDLKIPQDTFNKMVNEYFGIAYAQVPDYKQEVEKLGEHGDMRVERAGAWAKKNFSEEAWSVMESLAVTAPWIKVVEEIMEMTGEPKFEMEEGGEMKGELSLEDLREMQQDPRYWQEQDPAFVRKVRLGFEKHARKAGAG